MMWLSRINFIQKLCLMLALPCTALLVLIWNEMNLAYTEVKKLEYDRNLQRIHGPLLQLVHENQKERGLSAAFLANPDNDETKTRMQLQRETVDIEKQRLTDLIQSDLSTDRWKDKTHNKVQQIFDGIKTFHQSIRKQIDQLQLSRQQQVQAYTNFNKTLLSLLDFSATRFTGEDLVNQTRLYTNLAYAKDAMGIERAVLASIFAADRVDQKQRLLLTDINTQIRVYNTKAHFHAQALNSNDFQKKIKQISSKDMEAKKESVLNQYANFEVDPLIWFDYASKSINVVQEKINGSYKSAQSVIDNALVTSINKMKTMGAIALLIISITSFLVLNVAKAMNQSLKKSSR
jgi:hypothetical protein